MQLLKNQHSNRHKPRNGGLIIAEKNKCFTITHTITSTKKDGILYPDLELPEQSGEDIGRFGRMRQRYLKEHRKAYYSLLCMKLELNDHLREINSQAVEQIELITSQLAQAEGVTEQQLKARDQLGRVQAMNSCRARAEEQVVREIVLT